MSFTMYRQLIPPPCERATRELADRLALDVRAARTIWDGMDVLTVTLRHQGTDRVALEAQSWREARDHLQALASATRQ